MKGRYRGQLLVSYLLSVVKEYYCNIIHEGILWKHSLHSISSVYLLDPCFHNVPSANTRRKMRFVVVHRDVTTLICFGRTCEAQ